MEAALALRRLRAREGLGSLRLQGLDSRIELLCGELALLNAAIAELGRDEPVRSPLYADHARVKLGLLLSIAALECDDEAMRRVEAEVFSESETRRSNAIELLEMILPAARAERVVPLPAMTERPAQAPAPVGAVDARAHLPEWADRRRDSTSSSRR